jgi:HSP20 family protein
MEGTLTRYQPQSGATRLPDLVNRLFNESFVLPGTVDRGFAGGSLRPGLPVNLFDTPESYIMHVALPGISADKLEISVTGREVSIKGQYQTWTPENGTPIWQGIPAGEFYESYTLPVDLESDKVEATYHDGVLNLTLPKASHLRPRNIKVEVKQ